MASTRVPSPGRCRCRTASPTWPWNSPPTKRPSSWAPGAASPTPTTPSRWRASSTSWRTSPVKDPLAFRRSLLAASPRHLRVLDLVADKAGWGKPLPKGRGRGLAVHESFASVVAEVVDVVAEGTGFRVERVVCAVDCGTVVNPNTVEAQVEGGVTFGLSAALREAITIDQGRTVQTSLSEYAPLRMREAPVVEVHVVKTNEPPGGIGEPGVPPLAPAVANAVFAATGQRMRKLPLPRPAGAPGSRPAERAPQRAAWTAAARLRTRERPSLGVPSTPVQGLHQGASHHHRVRVRCQCARLPGRRDAEADCHRGRGCGARLASLAGRSAGSSARRASHARHADEVEEPARGLANGAQSGRWRRGRGQKDEGEARRLGQLAQAVGLLQRQVRHQHAVRARLGRAPDEGCQSHADKRIHVAEEDEGDGAACQAKPAHQVQHPGQRGAGLQRALCGGLDGGAVGQRV